MLKHVRVYSVTDEQKGASNDTKYAIPDSWPRRRHDQSQAGEQHLIHQTPRKQRGVFSCNFASDQYTTADVLPSL